MVCQPSAARPLAADRALVHRAARRLGHPASIPRAFMSRSPEALAFGSRRHFIPASLSLPLCGCLLNRSRDCSRSRVPPRFPRRRYADAPAAASFSACASLQRDLTGPPVGMAKLQAGLAVQLSSGELARFVWAPGCTETPLFLMKGYGALPLARARVKRRQGPAPTRAVSPIFRAFSDPQLPKSRHALVQTRSSSGPFRAGDPPPPGSPWHLLSPVSPTGRGAGAECALHP